jgi:hypothetical protein
VKNRRSIRLWLEQFESRVVPAIVGPPTPPPPYAVWGSSNWSGIDLNTVSSAVTKVTGSWQVPTVTGSGYGYSSTWVGIDGDQSSTVEQIGTEQDTVATAAHDGTPQYYAWYEMYPAYAYYATVTLNGTTTPAPVSPGDQITATVEYKGTQGSGRKLDDFFQLTITDSTPSANYPQGWTFTTLQAVPSHKVAQRSSAEWIEEAPSSGSVLPLANFGSVTFTGAQATIKGTTGTIASFVGNPAIINYGTATELREINIIDMGTFTRFGQWTSIKDETSLLNSIGDSFTVQFGATNPSAPSNGPLTHTASDRAGVLPLVPLSVPPVNNLTLSISGPSQLPSAHTVPALQEQIPTGNARSVNLATPSNTAVQATARFFADKAAVAAILSLDPLATVGGNAGVDTRGASLTARPLAFAPVLGEGLVALPGTPDLPGSLAGEEFGSTAPAYAIEESIDGSAAALIVLTVALYSWNGVALGDDETIRERERPRERLKRI